MVESESGGRSAVPGVGAESPDPRRGLLTPRLEGLLLGRAVAVTLLLGLAFIFHYRESEKNPQTAEFLLETSPIYGVVVFVYLLSILYAVIYRNLSTHYARARWFAYVQIGVDVLVVSYLQIVTGGVGSAFPFLYLLIVAYSGILLAGRGAFFSALFCSAAYPLALFLMRWMPEELLEVFQIFGSNKPEVPEIVYASFLNLGSSFLMAALTSYMAERLRRTGEQLARREIDYRALEVLHREIVTNLTSGIITVDAQGQITYVNRAAEQMLGQRLEEIYQSPLKEIFPDIYKAVTQSREQDPWRRPEVIVHGAGGLELDLGFSVSSLLEDGDRDAPSGEIIIFQDLTNLKRAEERLKRLDRLAAVGELAASIAHEIRNPLASISGSIQLLEKSRDLSDQDARLMNVIQREITRLDVLISNFLNYSRPMKIRPREIDLSLVVAEVLAAISPMQNPVIEIATVLEGSNFTLRADPDQLKQVIWNLLLNARQALQPAGGKIMIRLFRRGEGSSGACGFSITDSGPGIPDDVMKRIFTPFFTTRSDGSGLGLALVDRIVGFHGGIVDVENALEGGARFTVILPVEPPPEKTEGDVDETLRGEAS